MKLVRLLAVAILVCSAGAAQAVTPYTIVAIPDTQNQQGRIGAMTQWIANNHDAQNIVFATHEGDITSSGGSQLVAAATAMYKLDGHIPWGTVPGNHDYYGIAQYDTYFGPSHFAGQSWYGGSYEQSSWQTFQGGGRTFMSLEIQNGAPSDVLTWAQGVINAHLLPTIITTHDYMSDGTSARTGTGDSIWNNLVKSNNQIFMVLCGHVHANDGEYNQTSTNNVGQPVFEMLADYQSRVSGGNGLMRLVTLDEGANLIRVKTYSPTANLWETDADSQFNLSMDFDTRLVPEPATLLLLGISAMLLLKRRRKPTA